MNYKSSISIFLIFLWASCSTSKPKVVGSTYAECLPELFRSDLSQLIRSFDDFVMRNLNGVMGDFITAILNRDFPNMSEFNASDFETARQLRKNNFKDFIYTEYEEKLSDSDIEIEPPRTAGQSEPRQRMSIKVDIEKPYLNCLNVVTTDGNLITHYVNLHKKSTSVSPLVIADLFLDHQTDLDYGSKLGTTVVAVELYYMILNAATPE